MALLVGIAVASTPWVQGYPHGGGCVWTGEDAGQVEQFLREWVAHGNGAALVRWGVGLDGARGQIDLTTEADTYRIALALGPECSQPPDVRLLGADGRAGFPTASDLDALAAGFPARKIQLGGSHVNPTTSLVAVLFILAVFAGLGVAAVPSATARGSAAWRDSAWVLLLAGLAAWPILFVPFETDAPIIRAACVATNVFGDSFHPFLPFFLSRPSTWFSIEPWSLRLVPLAFLCTETMLTMWAARRDGGNLAGAFAGIWFACEIRRRHGLWDLSDWDFAGTFLMAMLLVLQRRTTRGWRDVLVLALLMVAGVMSSWLMIVVSGVLVGCLGIEAMRGRLKLGPAVAIGIVFAGLAALALSVFAAGSQVPPEIGVEDLWRQMDAELPMARNLTMGLPVALGIAWLLSNLDRLAAQFVTLCLIVVPLAVYVAHQRSHVAGGYYIGLVTPLLLYAAGVGTARAIDACADGMKRLGNVARLPWVRTAFRAALALALAIATVGPAGPGESPDATNHLQSLAQASRADSVPIYTNRTDLPRLLAFEWARLGETPLTLETALWGPAALRPRVISLQLGTCPPQPSSALAGFYVAFFGDLGAWRTCSEPLAAQCRKVTASPDDAPGPWLLFRCGSAGPDST